MYERELNHCNVKGDAPDDGSEGGSDRSLPVDVLNGVRALTPSVPALPLLSPRSSLPVPRVVELSPKMAGPD